MQWLTANVCEKSLINIEGNSRAYQLVQRPEESLVYVCDGNWGIYGPVSAARRSVQLLHRTRAPVIAEHTRMRPLP